MMMRKNLIALAATVTLAVGAANAATLTYTDVNGNWAQTDINNLTGLQIMTGYNDGQFHPDAWVTRAEFLNMTAKTLGLSPNKVTQVPALKNVSQNYWSFKNVDNQAWISAYPQGVFRPENPVRRAEVLAGLAGSLNKPLVSQVEADQILAAYTDANLVPAESRREVATAIRYNLFANDPAAANMIQPLEPATRAEVAAMLNRLYLNRDIAIVQNGQIVAMTGTDTTGTSTSTGMTGTGAGVTSSSTIQSTEDLSSTTTTGTGMDSTTTSTSRTYSSSSQSMGTSGTTGSMSTTGTSNSSFGTSPTGTTTTSTAAGTDNTSRYSEVREAGEADDSEAYKLSNANGDFTMGIGTTPYRNSADTIEEFRNPGVHPATGVQPLKTANLPTSTTFTGTVAKALYSEFNRPGDPVMVILDHTLMGADGRVAAPAGSRVLGRVTSVVPNNTSGNIAQLGITFHEIITPTGERFAINAMPASADGILRADAPQGVIFNPTRSTAALKREISASEGGWYGSDRGKMSVLETPMTTLSDDAPIGGLDQRTTPNIVLGVGDRLQLKVGTAPSSSTGTQNMNE